MGFAIAGGVGAAKRVWNAIGFGGRRYNEKIS
jgi:hypothetical protein